MRAFVFVVLMICLAMVAACGRISRPSAPEGSFYPHDYVVTQTP